MHRSLQNMQRLYLYRLRNLQAVNRRNTARLSHAFQNDCSKMWAGHGETSCAYLFINMQTSEFRENLIRVTWFHNMWGKNYSVTSVWWQTENIKITSSDRWEDKNHQHSGWESSSYFLTQNEYFQSSNKSIRAGKFRFLFLFTVHIHIWFWQIVKCEVGWVSKKCST